MSGRKYKRRNERKPEKYEPAPPVVIAVTPPEQPNTTNRFTIFFVAAIVVGILSSILLIKNIFPWGIISWIAGVTLFFMAAFHAT